MKVLVIDCCIRRDESRTRRLLEHIVNRLTDDGSYELEKLCLMDEPLEYFSEGFFNQRERLIESGELNHPRFRYAHQFQEADKIVVAAPFWDLAFPALLKVYIENLCVEGITFKSSDSGIAGCCNADHMVFLTTRGGFYNNSDMEMGSRYLEAMSKFFGIERYSCIAGDGIDMGIMSEADIIDSACYEIDTMLEEF